jgi:prepilin-type N-terminal cleavage/methylation domain-containing protein
MNQTKRTPRGGFTIIEVVLVLAIAGLIFLMVFIALPALQRSQRDTQRRDDIARLGTAITQYQTNNNGRLPATKDNDTTFVTNYLTRNGDSFNDPLSDNSYQVNFKDFDANGGATNSYDNGTYIINVYKKAACNGEAITSSKNSRNYAIFYNLEGSGVYCEDNS